MAKYYNRHSGSLAYGLKSGKTATFVGKTWTEVPAEEEGSEDLMNAIRKGYLHRWDDSEPSEELQAAEKASEPTLALRKLKSGKKLSG